MGGWFSGGEQFFLRLVEKLSWWRFPKRHVGVFQDALA